MSRSTRRRRINDSEDGDEDEAVSDQDVRPSSQRRRQTSRADAPAPAAGPSRSTDGGDAFNFDVDLRPHPLSRDQVPNLKNLMTELRNQDQNIRRCIELLNDTAEQVAEAFRTHDECAELQQAELDLRELMDVQAEKAIRRRVLEEITQDLQSGISLDDPAKRYKDEVQAHLDTYNKQTSRRKYAKNTDFHNFKNAVWVAREEGAMPPVRDLIPAEDGDEDDSDDEIVAGGQTQNFRCPLSANLLEDPLTNSNCTHSYSRAAIQNYVEAGNNKCPASACTAAVSRSSLKPDPGLAKKVAAFKRREEERALARRQTSTILY
ncbi:hypothetical protein PANT_9c00416 [Moesziomyces antarcticus T-34]|uniref:SP-RING-type domain-containing protein n=1 Tax=Pseudozyma antarctica (strain T-34) TaxID=1151754 RepID=M9LPH5_PSEA3|nr:hypothetical protein PANT_9c00416 [Moesziomyces antarcticus T-34]